MLFAGGPHAAGEGRAAPHDAAVRAPLSCGERRVHQERRSESGQQIHLTPPGPAPRCMSWSSMQTKN